MYLQQAVSVSSVVLYLVLYLGVCACVSVCHDICIINGEDKDNDRRSVWSIV